MNSDQRLQVYLEAADHEDARLMAFLTARYDEDEEWLFHPQTTLTREGKCPDEGYVQLVRFRDNLAVNRTIVRTAFHATDPTVSATLRAVLLLVVQPYEPHPDFDPGWLLALTELMTEGV